MNSTENELGARPRPIFYWRLWILDTLLVSVGLWFFLATNYGTYEFFGRACAMAVLPLIPVLVLVGGAGSTVFALTKVWIEKRALTRPTALALLVGPALVVALGLVIFGAWKSPNHRLSYICLGKTPASARHVRLAGYSTFLREEWLAVFNVEAGAFQSFVAEAKLVPADDFEFRRAFERTSLAETRRLPGNNPLATANFSCFKRVFNEAEEHQRGSVYAAFDPATSAAFVLREYHD